MENEELKSRMDRIIEWVKIGDTKASIMLSVLSLSVGIIFTSDFVLGSLKNVIVNTFVVTEKENFSWSALFAVLSAILAVFSLLCALGCYILVLRAKTNENQTKDQHLMLHSFIHFNHISELTYEEFVRGMVDVDVTKDLTSQIYINAKRCSEKYSDYNSGVTWTVVSFLSTIVMILSLLIYVSFNTL